MRYWLMKSEPGDCSIDDVLAMPNQTVAWYGVRNYQARNFMRDQMQLGDKAFFYHSNCAEPGIVGLAQIVQRAYPDETQFDAKSKYFDPKATRDRPRWLNVDVRVTEKKRLLSLAELRACPDVSALRVLARGNRLSITPVDPAHWRFICRELLGVEP